MEKKVAVFDRKIKKIIKVSIKNKNYEKALCAISLCGNMYYFWNQFYTDEYLEQALMQIEKDILTKTKINKNKIKQNTVLFYDGFGFDTRGLALIYLKALCELGYKVIYVTLESAKGRQPEIDKTICDYNAIKEYLSCDSYITDIKRLNEIFEKYCPSNAFLYAYDNDITGIVVFEHYNSIINRFQINLTDHAFWLGTHAFDYCLEFRDYGASISANYRNIDAEKLIMFPYYPYIDYDIHFKGFPFSYEGYKIIFSGGALYKTLGEGNKYYNIVNYILKNHSDVIFLYAGEGDDTELKKLQDKYFNRVYHIDERKDLYQILKHSYIYLNTYPMLGGLMTQYAAAAGKIPITLKHNNDSDGLLINQDKLNIEYETVDELLNDMDRLLTDTEYLKERESMMIGSVITEKEFQSELNNIIKNHRTKYKIHLKDINTNEFRSGYIERFSREMYINIIANKKNLSLVINFPLIFAEKCLRKLFGK